MIRRLGVLAAVCFAVVLLGIADSLGIWSLLLLALLTWGVYVAMVRRGRDA